MIESVLYKLYPLVREQPTWPKLIDRVNSITDIDEGKRFQWKRAIEFLKSELGTAFFTNCGTEHPVYIKLTNAPWLVDDLIDFANTLKLLKTTNSNYPILFGKIKARKKCITEGKFFVEIASTYLKEGFRIKFLENVTYQKSPDIEVVDPITNEKFFIEVSQVNDSMGRSRINEEFHVILDTLLNYGFDLLYSYKQLKHFEKDEIGNVIYRIKEMKDEAAINRSFLILRNEMFDLAVAHPDKNKELMKWCKKNGRDKGASGLPVDFNETPRILAHQKIYKKVKQIPAGFTGIIYMPVQFLYFFSMNPGETIVGIIDEIKQYPDLLGVVLYANLGQPIKEEFVEIENTIKSIKMINGMARHLLFVYNYQYTGNLQEETWQKIKKCFS